MNRREKIKAAVVAEIRNWLLTEDAIDEAAEIIADLGMESDDTGLFALSLEIQFRTRIPGDEWRKASTVGDVIDLFDKYLAHEDVPVVKHPRDIWAAIDKGKRDLSRN